MSSAWRKSSYSGNDTGGCVEVGTTDAVLIRDTTLHGTGPVLSVPPATWTRFLTTIR